jgi:hypothetical protein
MKQERKRESGDHAQRHSNSTLLKLDTTDQVVDAGNNMTKEYGNTTPSTSASTRSSSTKSASLQNAMSGLTLTDSLSPSGHESLSTSITSSSRITAMTGSSNGSTRHPKPPSNHGTSQPSSSTSPMSRTSKATSRSSNSRISYSELKIKSQDAQPYPPPPPSSKRRSSSSSDWDTCIIRTSDGTSSSRVSKQSGSRRSRMSKSQRSPPESDEEREKVDTKITQRAGQAVSSDSRQQNSSSNITMGRTNLIKLHVYDLIAEETMMQLPWGCNFPIGTCFNVVNSGLHTLGTGAYHVGIEVSVERVCIINNDVIVYRGFETSPQFVVL